MIAGVAGAVVLAIAREIVRPLAQVADTLDAIAYAELDSAAPLQPTRGEIARLLAATDRLADVIGERQRRELVHNDLDRTWQAARRVNLSNLARQVESATEVGIQPIVDGTATLQLKADGHGGGAGNRARGVRGDRARRRRLASHEPGGRPIVRPGDPGGRGNIRAGAARQRAGPRSGRARHRLARDHRCAGKAANQIGDIVSVINDIAAQTNLLALNATIEAARAGEAGAAFRWSPPRSRRLATQTGKSTEQIGAKVAEIQSTTREVVAALSSVAETIDQFSDVTVSVSAAIEQQRDATENFAASARETSAAVSDVAGRMAGIADMVQRSRATAQEVSAVAEAMQSTSQILCRENPGDRAQSGQSRFARIPTLRSEADRAPGTRRPGLEVAVHDISEGGARIDGEANLALGDQVALTFPGMKAIAAEVVRRSDDGFGICFRPARLRLEELRDLVTSQERAA